MRTARNSPGDARPIRFRTRLRSGDLGRLIALHGTAYQTGSGFGLDFEAYVARTVAEFVLENDSRGRIWLAEREGELLGSAAIVERPGGRGQLRWVLVVPEARGAGLGRKLVEAAIEYCRERGFCQVYLYTTDGLEASMRLYEDLGFEVTKRTIERLWDRDRPLIRMARKLATAGNEAGRGT